MLSKYMHINVPENELKQSLHLNIEFSTTMQCKNLFIYKYILCWTNNI